jgi:hypothetical protein
VVAVSSVRRARGESDRARRTFKLVKNGVKSAGDLTAEEYGLLYLHYPHILPDVEVGE